MRKMCDELVAREKMATIMATWTLYQGKGEEDGHKNGHLDVIPGKRGEG